MVGIRCGANQRKGDEEHSYKYILASGGLPRKCPLKQQNKKVHIKRPTCRPPSDQPRLPPAMSPLPPGSPQHREHITFEICQKGSHPRRKNHPKRAHRKSATTEHCHPSRLHSLDQSYRRTSRRIQSVPIIFKYKKMSSIIAIKCHY